MKGWFKRGLGTILLASTLATASAQDKPVEPVTPKISIERAIEKEIRKHDPWVETYIDSDYTDNKKEGHASLAIFPEHLTKAMKKMNFMAFSGMWSDSRDKLIFPSLNNSDSVDSIIDSVDHELSHALYDSEGKKGLFHSKNFRGPSIDEIADYCKEKVSGKEFKKLKKDLRAQKEWERIKGDIKIFAQNYAEDYATKLTSLKESYAFMKKFMKGDKSYSKILEERKKHAKAIVAYQDMLKEACLKIKEWEKDTVNRAKSGKDSKAKYVIKARKMLVDYSKKLDPLKEGVKDIHGYQVRLIDEVYKKTETNLNKAKEAKDEFNELIYSSRLAMLDLRKNTAGLATCLNPLKSTTVQLEAGMHNLDARYMDSVLGNPNETFARVVDSAYSLYFGEVKSSKFPLNEKDLSFLERFKYKKDGKLMPIFGKGVSKYRLGLQMIEDGYNPGKVKDMLEYSTSFKYKGKEHSWPAADFTVKGKIPVK